MKAPFSTRAILIAAVAAQAGLMLLLVLHALLMLRSPLGLREQALLALEIVILAAGHTGLAILLAAHLRELIMHRVQAASHTLALHAQGHWDERVPESGPREIAALAAAVNKSAEAMERRQRQILQEAHGAAASTLLLGVAHEIRNPLAAARLSAQGLAIQTDPERRASAHARLLRSIDRLEDVVRTLQAVARPGGAADPNRIVRGSLMAIQGEMLHLQDPIVELQAQQRVECDAGIILQSLVALLRNAIEATPPSQAITVRTRDEDGWVTIHVRDPGPGLPPELGDRVFEPFTTTKPGHAGLGLATARQSVESQGGTLRLHSHDGVEAVMRLPARE